MGTPGLKADCETILGRFQETDSVRFEEFAAIWKDMKFSHIYFGGMRNLEMSKFAREALSVASHYFLPPYTFQIRVGALYLLYGLYNSQLCQPKQKIRVALKDWDDIEKFYQDLIGAQHLDAAYIMRQLRLSRAFHFTGMAEFLTFRSQRNQPRHVGREEFKDVRDRVQDLVTSETLEEMLNIHEHYQKTKCLISADKSQPDRSLSLVKEDYVPNLKQLLSEHVTWKLEKGKPRTKNDDEKEENEEEKEATSQESEKESSERAKTLARIKSKCYGAVTQAPKSRRHRQVLMASSESSSDCGGKNTQKSKRKRRVPRKTGTLKGAKLGKLTKKASQSKKNMPTIPEEDSTSSSSEDNFVPKRTRKN
ncbi:hypothetical protein XENTR_v10021819 [Xenopus tropicalis]|uniref:Small nuclear RNA activating complex, polypeptide 1, 43kDa n=1 Tax=Xenopus tropicalis TaxID=8364 RepID=F6VTK1_XENTR|eukprot:XP_012824096.1 PREDICTED: snRNA-activating protein complex subunit 1 isoform X1 [Xenopus tropicalis]